MTTPVTGKNDRDARKDHAGRRETPAFDEGPLTKSGTIRVIAVTENEGSRSALRSLFHALPEFAQRESCLECVSLLSSAIECIEWRHFDLLLIDLAYLGKDNAVTLKNLRATLPSMPTLAFVPTASDLTDLPAESMLGVQDYFVLDQLTPRALTVSLTSAIVQNTMATEIDKHLKRLSFNESALHEIISKNADGILILSVDGVIRFSNPAARSLFGVVDDDFVDSPFGVPACASDLMELQLVTRNGEPKIVELRFVNIVWDEELCLLASLRDITRHKLLQEELIEARLAAETAARKAAEAQAIAEAASMHKSDFLARMSHEIRTPLNGIVGMTSLLLEEGMASRPQSFAETIRNSSEILLNVINDILDFSKVEAGKVELEDVDFDLRAATEETIELFSDVVKSKPIVLANLVLPDVPRMVRGDPGRVRQILNNLVSNALKFTVSGKVLVRVATRGDSIQIEVEDTGIGISEEAQGRLFQPFHQADTSTTRNYGGTGLGLAICRRLAELMGGTVSLSSALGKGSTFRFNFPLSRVSESREALSFAPPPDGYFMSLSSDPHILDVLHEQGKALGFACASAQDEEAARAIFARRSPEDPLRGFIIDDRVEAPWPEAVTQSFPKVPILWLTSRSHKNRTGLTLELGALTHSALTNRLRSLYDPKAIDEFFGQPPEVKSDLPVALRDALILVAEDNAVNQRVVMQMLEKLHYRFQVVGNGQEAIDLLQVKAFDLVLMDCEMPVLDGYSATRAIRTSGEAFAGITIIATTAYALSGDRQKCFAAGMSDYISKPVDLYEFGALLRKWLPPPEFCITAATDFGSPKPTPRSTAATSDDGVEEASPSPLIDLKTIASLREIGDEELLSDLFNLFSKSAPDLIEIIRDAAVQSDPLRLKTAAHTLRGSAGNIGALSMMAIATELEALGRRESIEGAAHLIGRLEGDFQKLSHIFENEILRSLAPFD